MNASSLVLESLALAESRIGVSIEHCASIRSVERHCVFSWWTSQRCWVRPVVTQETGFSRFIPSGEGLFGFSTMVEAVGAIEAIEADYERHHRAAQEIAAAYFDAHKVLTQLFDDVYATER